VGRPLFALLLLGAMPALSGQHPRCADAALPGPDRATGPPARPPARRLQHLPPVVTLHLKRFQQDWRGRLEKRDTKVPFALQLDLQPFLAPGCPAAEAAAAAAAAAGAGGAAEVARAAGTLYELLGVVVHQGSMRGAPAAGCLACCAHSALLQAALRCQGRG
jgi:hypothetical protein